MSILVLTTAQCTENNYYNNQNSSNVEGLDSALLGTWTETTLWLPDSVRLNIYFGSDGKCATYYSYGSRDNEVFENTRIYWTSSNELFTHQLDGDYMDVGDYEIINGELHLSRFDQMDEWNDRTLAK